MNLKQLLMEILRTNQSSAYRWYRIKEYLTNIWLFKNVWTVIWVVGFCSLMYYLYHVMYVSMPKHFTKEQVEDICGLAFIMFLWQAYSRK